MKAYLNISLVAVLGVCINVFGETLTWDDCVKEAAEHSPELLAAKSTLQGSEFLVLGSRSDFFPQISAIYNYSYGNYALYPTTVSSTTTLSSATGVSSSPLSTFSATYSGTENIFNGFADVATIAQAKATREANRSALVAARAKVNSDLKVAFANLVYAQDFIVLTKDIVNRRVANLALVTALFDGGVENKGSMLLAKAYWKQSLYDSSQANHALSSAQIQLAQVLGRTSGLSNLSVVKSVLPAAISSETDLKMQVMQTPAYLTALAAEKTAAAAVILARAPLFPVVSANASFGGSYNDSQSSNRWLLGLSFSYNLFNGGLNFYGLKTAIQNFRSATLTKQDILALGETSIYQTRVAYLDALKKLESDRAFVDATTVREKIATAQYQNGLVNFDDWDIAESDLVARQKTVLLSEQAVTNTQAASELAMGIGVIP